MHITCFTPPSPYHIPNVYDENKAKELYNEYSTNFTNSVASVILLHKGLEVTRHTAKDEHIMGNLLSGGNGNFLNKHDIATNGTVMDITKVEYRNADPGSEFGDQWIVSVRDTRTQVDLGLIGFPTKTESRNNSLRAISDSIEVDGPYVGVVLKELPPRSKLHNPFYVLNDYQGNIDDLPFDE